MYLSGGEELECPTKVRFVGPLIMALLSEFGDHLHLPWYCGMDAASVSQIGVVKGVEVISPISVATRDRCSSLVGGEGRRLVPSGYTLFEYQNEVAKVLCAHVGRLSGPNADLSDWCMFLNNYPLSKQKASKHQGEVGAYLAVRESQERHSALADISGFLRQPDCFKPELLGKAQVSARVLLHALKKLSFRGPSVESEAYAALTSMGWLVNGKILWPTLKNDIGALVRATSGWRASILSHATLASEEMAGGTLFDAHVNQIELSLQTGHWQRPGRKTTCTEVGCICDMLNQVLRTESERYYETVLALACSVLKATIWNMWLCMDGDEFRLAADDLWKQRRKGTLLPFTAVLWNVRGT
jgi:hypothetical protein